MPPIARRLALVGLSLGYFMVLFDTTALTVALPDLADDLAGGVADLAWVTNGYTLTFSACLLAGGVVADRRGADRTFLAAVLGFGAVSAACAGAPSTGALVAGRAVLGVAGALMLPASLSLVARLHGEPARRARAIAAWASISGSALATGPLLGGLVVDRLGWRGIFLVNVPVALLAAFLVRGRLPGAERRRARVDPRGQFGVLVAVTAFTWALIRGGTAGWTRADVALALLLAVGAGAGAVHGERTSAAPAVPGPLLRAPMVAGAILAGFVVGGVLAGELFVTTLQLQHARGLDPVATGAAFLPLTAPMVLNPPLAGRLVARLGPARPVLGGLTLIAIATGLMATLPATASYASVAAGLVLLGLGMSLTLPALTAAVVLAAPQSTTGVAGGLFSVVRQAGAAVGVAAAAAAIGPRAGEGGRGHAVMAVAAAVAVAGWWLACRRAEAAPAAAGA